MSLCIPGSIPFGPGADVAALMDIFIFPVAVNYGPQLTHEKWHSIFSVL